MRLKFAVSSPYSESICDTFYTFAIHSCRLQIYICDFKFVILTLAIYPYDLSNYCALTLSMLGKNFSRFHFEIFF